MAQLFKMDLKLEGLEDLRQTFSGDLIRKAMRSALDQSATFGKKQIVDLVTSNYNIETSKAKEAIEIVRTTQTSNEIIFRIKGKILSLYHHFHAVQDAQGVMAFVKKRDAMRIPHAFIRISRKGWTGVMIRKTAERYPLSWKVNRGPSIPALVKGALWDIASSDVLAYFKWIFWDQLEKRSKVKFK
jgi:uncharacterized protein YxjI